MKQSRINKVLEQMIEHNLSQIIISEPSSIFYLTGIWIEPDERMVALLLKADGGHKFFINSLFSVHDDLGIDKIRFGDDEDGGALVSRYVDKSKTVGIDKLWPSHFLLSLMKSTGSADFVNSSPILDRIRMIKDKEEIDLMRKASQINDLAMEKLIAYLAGGYAENEMALKLSEVYIELGAQGFSFPPIISYGKNSSIAHAETTTARPEPGDSCTLDIGCVYNHYCSDMTRNPFFKSVSDRHREIYEISLEATLAGQAAVKPGARFCDIDKAARDVIEKAGYGQYFLHRVGHSCGLNCHDFGNVSPENKDIVLPGMIFSVEPSITIPGELGVRVEDLVLVTENGHETLNNYKRELQVIG